MATWIETAPSQVIKNVLENIEVFSDKEKQMYLWAGKNNTGCEIGMFSEEWCQLFDDSGLGEALEKSCTGLSMEADYALQRLDQLLSGINDDRRQEEIILDKQMEEVRKVSSELKALLDKQVNRKL